MSVPKADLAEENQREGKNPPIRRSMDHLKGTFWAWENRQFSDSWSISTVGKHSVKYDFAQGIFTM